MTIERELVQRSNQMFEIQQDVRKLLSFSLNVKV